MLPLIGLFERSIWRNSLVELMQYFFCTYDMISRCKVLSIWYTEVENCEIMGYRRERGLCDLCSYKDSSNNTMIQYFSAWGMRFWIRVSCSLLYTFENDGNFIRLTSRHVASLLMVMFDGPSESHFM